MSIADTSDQEGELLVLLPEGWQPLDLGQSLGPLLPNLLQQMQLADSIEIDALAILTEPFTEVDRLVAAISPHVAAITVLDVAGQVEIRVVTILACQSDTDVEATLVEKWRSEADIAYFESVGRSGVSNQVTWDVDRPAAFTHVDRFLIKDRATIHVGIYSTSTHLSEELQQELLDGIGIAL